MQNLKKILHCRKNRRCNRPLSCKFCGESWQRWKQKGFITCLDTLFETQNQTNTPLTFLTIKPKTFGTLRTLLNDIINFSEEIQKLKKRDKLPIYYGRLEVSFSNKFGFFPHFHFLVWGDYSTFNNLSHELGLTIEIINKTNDKATAHSIAKYMLKYTHIGKEEGEAVRVALEKKRTVLHSKEFNFREKNYIDELIDKEFPMWGAEPIRSKEEIRLRAEHKKTLRGLRSTLNAKILKANNQMWNN